MNYGALKSSSCKITICDVPTHYGNCNIFAIKSGWLYKVSIAVISHDRWVRPQYIDMTVPFFLTRLTIYMGIRYLTKTYGKAGEVTIKKSETSKEPVVYDVSDCDYPPTKEIKR